MSFRCSVEHGCGKAQPSGSTPVRKVLKVRKKFYSARKYKYNKGVVEDPGGVGEEIALEVVLCQPCSSAPA